MQSAEERSPYRSLTWIRVSDKNQEPRYRREVFWLHSNANLTAAINEGMGLLTNAMSKLAEFERILLGTSL